MENIQQFIGYSTSKDHHFEDNNMDANNSTQMNISILQLVPTSIYESMHESCGSNESPALYSNVDKTTLTSDYVCNETSFSLSSSSSTSLMSLEKKQTYYQRRKKNNEAAKKSRDARIKREQDLTLQAALLLNENTALKARIKILEEKQEKY